MFARKVEAPMTVQVPGPTQDRPSWTKVGVIAALGFIAGVVWPRLAGVRLGPSVPEAPSASVVTASSASNPSDAPAGTTPAVVVSTAPPAARPAGPLQSATPLVSATAGASPPAAPSAAAGDKPA